MSDPQKVPMPEPLAPGVIRILIELDPVTRNIIFNANITDSVVFLGLLEQTKMLFMQALQKQAAEGSRIALAPAGMKIMPPNGGYPR